MSTNATQNTVTFIAILFSVGVVIVSVMCVQNRQKQRIFKLRQYQMQNFLPPEWGDWTQQGRMGPPPAEDAIIF